MVVATLIWILRLSMLAGQPGALLGLLRDKTAALPIAPPVV
jgi:hypothetical protein